MPSHRCPSWCHKCPDLIAIVMGRGGDVDDEMETTMPMCMGGMSYGIGGCYCEANVERDHRTADRAAAIERLRVLIEAYPKDARRLLNAMTREQPANLHAVSA